MVRVYYSVYHTVDLGVQIKNESDYIFRRTIFSSSMIIHRD